MLINQNCLVTKAFIKSFSTFAFSVSSVKVSPSFSSVGMEELEKEIYNILR